MSKLLSVLLATGLFVFWAPPTEAGHGAGIRQSLRNVGKRSLQRVKTLKQKASTFGHAVGDRASALGHSIGQKVGTLGHKVGAVGQRVGNFGKGVTAKVGPAKRAFGTAINESKQQRRQDRLFKDFYKEIRAESLGRGTVRRAYWVESLKRGVPFTAPGAIASGTLGLLAGFSAVLEISAGYVGDALTLGAISAAGVWGAKRLTQAKRRGKAFARGALVARVVEAGALPEAALANELHLALSAYNKSDQLRVGQLEQRKAGTGLLKRLQTGWAKVKLPFARAKEKRSRKALERFEAAFSAPAAPIE